MQLLQSQYALQNAMPNAVFWSSIAIGIEKAREHLENGPPKIKSLEQLLFESNFEKYKYNKKKYKTTVDY
jgi:hypothetical protein